MSEEKKHCLKKRKGPEEVAGTKKRRTYSGSFKATVVREYLRDKKGLVSLAEQYGLHPNQIKNWSSILLRRAGEVLDDKRKNRKKGAGGDSESRPPDPV